MPPRSVKLVLGGPGTGKTTYFVGRDADERGEELPGVIGNLLASGVRPEEIAYVSFTKKAAQEAAARAARRFGLDPRDMPHFRTIHSMAYRGAGVSHNEVMQREDYRQIARLLGVQFTGYYDPADGPANPSKEGDLILQWMDYARARCIDIKQVWQQSGEAVEWKLVKKFVTTVDQYKQDMGKLDFADMLERFTSSGYLVPVKAAIIDEAQDLSTAQWNAARSAFRNVPTIYLGGDDDQAIHSWAGADVEHLLRIKAERIVLPVSHRLPVEVFNLATNIATRIRHRFPKDWKPATHSGHVHHVATPDNVKVNDGRTWMLLARNSCFLDDYAVMCKEQGVPYTKAGKRSVDADHVEAIITWERLRKGAEVGTEDAANAARFIRGFRYKAPTVEGSTTLRQLQDDHGLQVGETIWHDALDRIHAEDREYYTHCLRNGYRLQDEPPVHIGTIHSVKGGEADAVVLKSDMTYRTAAGMERDPDGEHRTFYTGATRAKRELYIVDKQEREGYGIG